MATAPYFITEAQFVGTLNLDFGSEGFDSYLAIEVEKSYLISLLGYQLFLALIADLDASNDPQTDKYTYIVNGIETGYTGSSGVTERIEGIKYMLKYMYYAEYQKRVQSHQTTIGQIELQAVNATKTTQRLYGLYVQAWNEGLLHYYQLINYMNYQNSENGSDYYDEFNPSEIKTINTFGIV